MKQNRRKTSFRDELRRMMLTSALVPLLAATLILLGILGFILLNNVMGGSSADAAAATRRLDQTRDLLTEKLDAFALELDIARYLRDTSYSAQENERLYRFVNEQQAVPRFYLLGADNKVLFSTETDAAERERCGNLIYWRLIRNLKDEGENVVSLLARSVTQDNTRAYLMTGRALMDGAGRTAGYICFLISDQAYTRLLAETVSSVLIADQFGNVFVDGMSVFLGGFGKLTPEVNEHSGFLKRENNIYYVIGNKTREGQFSVYAVRECGSILATLIMLAAFVLLLFSAIILVVLISTKRIADQKMKIIDEITEAFESAQAGCLSTRLKISSSDEFRVIGDAYNSMLDSIRSLMERSVALAQETAASKVRQLESQFNPHFLFNTLENVRFMIRMNPKAADEMILNLSELLRYSIATDSDTVTLDSDLRYTMNYLNILKARFGKRLSCGINVEEGLGVCRVPRLAAQPIIENAVKYGMEAKASLHITIEATARENKLILRICDDGDGIDQATLTALNQSMADPIADGGGHYGILNVHVRIKLMYGEAYGVKIHTEKGVGTAVELSFPYHEGENTDDFKSADSGR